MTHCSTGEHAHQAVVTVRVRRRRIACPLVPMRVRGAGASGNSSARLDQLSGLGRRL
jgi:hypothetical protein